MERRWGRTWRRTLGDFRPTGRGADGLTRLLGLWRFSGAGERRANKF